MKIEFKKEDYIEVLKKTGLNEKEALIYFELIKQGSKGSTVYELDHHFNHVLKRTTIYSILRKLLHLGFIKENLNSESQKKATIFVAVNPNFFFNNIIGEKQKELDFIKDLRDNYLDFFNSIYEKGMEISLNDIDETLSRYIKHLVDKNWKITSFFLKEKSPMFEYIVYECMLEIPKAKYLKSSSFHLFLFEYDIEKDKNALQFFIRGMKKETKQIISHFSDIKEYKLKDINLEFFNNTYPGFNITVNLEDIKKSKFFEEIVAVIKSHWDNDEKIDNPKIKVEKNKEEKQLLTEELLSKEYLDIWKAVIIPIKRKLFFLWAESYDFLEEMVRSVFLVEKMSLDRL